MPYMNLARCFMCMALMHSTFNHPRTDGYITGACHCNDEKGNTYNLAELQKIGAPRFPRKKAAGQEYYVSYNPCISYDLPTVGDCFGDLAICLSSGSYDQNIGKQSTSQCCLYTNGTPYLEYTNKVTFPWRTNIVNLKCDKGRITPDSAKFEVISLGDNLNRRIFVLSHICACPNACPIKPATASIGSSKVTNIAVPVGISAFICIVAVPVVIWIYRKRQRNNDPHLIDDERPDYETINNVSQTQERKKDVNLHRNKSPPVLASSRSCSDITVTEKDDFNNGNNSGRASAPV